MSDAHGADQVPRSRRAGVVLEVRYRNAGQFLVSYCTNLSRGGLFVTTDQPLGKGTTLTLEMSVPGRAVPVTINAEVRWTRPSSDDSGPAGMGLRFSDIDTVLGEHIDRLVTHAAPLRIEILGRGDQGTRHLDSLLHSLLTCETRELELIEGVENVVGRPDFVLVDVDAAPALALSVIASIADRSDAPPVLALCSDRSEELRAKVSRHAQVVPTPVENEDLRARILATLSRVEAIRVDRPQPEPS